MQSNLAVKIETTKTTTTPFKKLGEIWVNKLTGGETRAILFDLLSKGLVDVKTFNLLTLVETKFEVAEKFELVTGRVSDIISLSDKPRSSRIPFLDIYDEITALGYKLVTVEILFFLMTRYDHFMKQQGHFNTMVEVSDIIYSDMLHSITLSVKKPGVVEMITQPEVGNPRFSRSSDFLLARKLV
ncbi:MAG: hypothetical protein RLZZ230_5 [Candidatus Parcubacteria bacterium]